MIARLSAVLTRILERPPAEDAIPLDINLRKLGLDSLKAIAMLVEVESTFGTSFRTASSTNVHSERYVV